MTINVVATTLDIKDRNQNSSFDFLNALPLGVVVFCLWYAMHSSYPTGGIGFFGSSDALHSSGIKTLDIVFNCRNYLY